MQENQFVKLVVFVPEEFAQKVRNAIGKAGAGKTLKYKHASFSVKGVGRFIPLAGANPAVGKVGKLEEVVEERIETVCLKKDLSKIIKAIKRVHPYEEIVLDIYPLNTNTDWYPRPDSNR